ncbi:MAG: acetyl/propionyl/methylcrotonyl-CoA carboxylase subunit alpha [Acuticoccus sp.]
MTDERGKERALFDRLLIANRGEIAVRIIRTARRLGIGTVAVYSEADRGAYHTRVADTAVLIGPADARRSYLDAERIIHAAREHGASAIHPGYGFLSENAEFAEKCAAAGLVFVGPPAEAIRAMGSKARAKGLMERAGVPVVPGYHGEIQEPGFLKRKAYEVGYPVLIKAVAGGGGKGMRRVDLAIDFDEALASARREAKAAFGDDRVLIERCIAHPRHIEIQVFADTKGRTVSLHERDCSLQRRHQKVVEEAPAPGISRETRAAMGAAAVRAAEAVGYVGAGTVEFIAPGGERPLAPDAFHFMEMNTRLQVEHPVTEAVMGVDLVEWQLRVAAGEPLPAGEPRQPRGHAVEVRLYAEDPDNDFLPSAGRLDVLRFAHGVRVDSGVEAGDTVNPHYDPMIAKLIVEGEDRATALEKLAAALDGTVAIGPRTNLPFLRQLVAHPEFVAGTHDTGLIGRDLATMTGGKVSTEAIAAAAAKLIAPAGDAPASAPPAPADAVPTPGWHDPFDQLDGFRLTGEARQEVALEVDGAPRVAEITSNAGGQRISVDGVVGDPEAVWVIEATGDAFAIEAGRAARVHVVDQLARRLAAANTGHARAPMHGRIVVSHVAIGDTVARARPAVRHRGDEDGAHRQGGHRRYGGDRSARGRRSGGRRRRDHRDRRRPRARPHRGGDRPMKRRLLLAAALVVLMSAGAASAQATRIVNPDGTKVDVVTNNGGSLVTSYNDAGRQTDKLRYPAYRGEEGHERLLKLLSPPGAEWIRQ